MPFFLIRQDITKMHTDAIVNAANRSLLGGGGVDGAIHRAAGPGLLEECRTLCGCETGDAKLTGAYQLPCRYVIHTVGPIWSGGASKEEELLRSCYRKSLLLAAGHALESIAFPLISGGIYGYPKQEALRIAQEEITAFLDSHDMLVYLCLFDREALSYACDVKSFVSDRYVEEKLHACRREDVAPSFHKAKAGILPRPAKEALHADADEYAVMAESQPRPVSGGNLEERIRKMDQPFSKRLFRLIDEKGISDVECYTRANLDRRHFSKIRSNEDYRPSKETVLALCFGLGLCVSEAEALLKSAGYALSDSTLSDVIVRYYLEKKIYDIFEVNQALFDWDQRLLGSA